MTPTLVDELTAYDVLDVLEIELEVRQETAELVWKRIRPEPTLTVSEWADARRVIPEGTSPEPGRWRTSRVPYLREMMDAVSDDAVQEVVGMMASQVGKTEFELNVAGYYIDEDPSPILVLVPTESFGKTWSKDRLAGMLRVTPTLKDAVAAPKSRDSENTILHKVYDGGSITIVGTNSATNLSSRPIRIVLGDEIDRFPEEAGDEGAPLALAEKRQRNFWNRKRVYASTPTVKGFSEVERRYERSSRGQYWVPCPECEELHVLEWKAITWEDNEAETARWACPSCGSLVDEASKAWMLARGEWRHRNPERPRRGYHLSALYSPWATWAELVEEWLDAQGDHMALKAFVNTALAESWEEDAEEIDPGALLGRREPYGDREEPVVPKRAAILTAAVDVQGDRLEVLVQAWGKGEESWVVHFRQLWGDPAAPTDEVNVWDDLEEVLTMAYPHAAGAQLRILATAIDTGGHHADQVYRFCKPRQARKVFPLKGMPGAGRALLGRPSKNNALKVKLFPVGTITAKDVLFARLRIAEPGPGYIHLPTWIDEEFVAQVTSEKVVTRFHRGRPTRTYEQTRDRNEALDLLVYNMAALARLGPAIRNNLGKLVDQVNEAGAEAQEEGEEDGGPGRVRRRRRGPGGPGWVGEWGR